MKTIFEFLMSENDADVTAQFRLLRAIRDGTIDLNSIPHAVKPKTPGKPEEKGDTPLSLGHSKGGRKCERCENPLKKGEHSPCRKCRLGPKMGKPCRHVRILRGRIARRMAGTSEY